MEKLLSFSILPRPAVLGMLGTTLLALLPCSHSAFATIGFKSAVSYPVGKNPEASACGDFDGDGKIDLAVVNSGEASVGDDGGVSILLGNGVGTFHAGDNSAAPETKKAEFEHEASASENVVRLISVGETAYFRTHGRYATFAELVRSGQMEETARQSSAYLRAFALLNLHAESQPIPGFVLVLLVPSDGSQYQLSLTQQRAECGFGWFTNASGTLYQGKAVDCAEPMPTSDPSNWAPPDIDVEVPPVRSDTLCPLPEILYEAGKRAQELVENLQRFAANEQIEHIEFGNRGKLRNSTSQRVNYTAEIRQSPSGTLWVEEDRSGATENLPPLLTDAGTAAFALIFHPRHVVNFDIRCEGEAELHGVPAWQLRFEEHDDPSKSFHDIRVKNSTYHLRFKGRAWIALDHYEVLRLETDLIAPVAKIGLQLEHMEITYAPVEFRKRMVRLWLPERATFYISYHGHRIERVHQFSKFQLFWVDTNESVKVPNSGPD